MPHDPFDGLVAFLAVARHRSFTAAASELGVTPTAVSQKIKVLEQRLGSLLFRRTTRTVALTDGGAAFAARLAPATREIEDAIDALGDHGGRPAGTLRITAPRITGPSVVAPLVRALREAHPEIVVEASLDDAFVDIVEAGFDAGIRQGDAVEKDMIRVRISEESRWSIVGAPAYFAEHGRPKTPDDLVRHRAIRQRLPTSKAIYRWELSRRGRAITVDVPSAVVVDDVDLMIRLAVDGLGLAYVPDERAAEALARGALERVLESHVGRGPGMFLYFPARAQTQPKLRALVDIVSRRTFLAPAAKRPSRR